MKFPSRFFLFFLVAQTVGLACAVFAHLSTGELIVASILVGAWLGWWLDAVLDERERREA